MHIETSRLILRPFTERDAEAAAHNSKTPTVAHFMSDMVLDTTEDAANWIHWLETKCNDDEPCRVLAIELKDTRVVVGLVGVAPKRELDGEIERMFAVADEHQSKGYATEAAKAIIWWAFEDAGQDVLSAIVKPDNIPSRRVIEKLGFVYCDTRTLPYDRADCEFDYFRLYHTDYLPGPEWDLLSLCTPELMDGFFDIRADTYDDHMLSGYGEEIYSTFCGFIPATGDAISILDIGCGTGIELDYIWAKAPNAHITCVDMSRGMLDLLIKNHAQNWDKITVVEASYTDWQYPVEAFDLALSSMTMHHLTPEGKLPVYKNICRALKSGGCYYESDFIVDSWQAAQYRQRYEIVSAALPSGAVPGDYHIDIPCTVEEELKLLSDACFLSVDVLDNHIRLNGSRAVLRAAKAAYPTVRERSLER